MIAREANPDLVRVATWNDAAELMDICRADHAENGVGSFSAEKSRGGYSSRRWRNGGCY